MKPENITKIREEVTAELQKNLVDIQKLNRDWVTDYSKYVEINSDLLNSKRIATENLFDVWDFDSMETAVKEFREEKNMNKNKIWMQVHNDINAYSEDSAEMYFEIRYYVVQDIVEEYQIKNKVKGILAEKLYNYVKDRDEEWAKRQQPIDCKLLELFKDLIEQLITECKSNPR